jgi:hypothetical protein
MDPLEVLKHHEEAKNEHDAIAEELSLLQHRVRQLEAKKRLAEIKLTRKWRVYFRVVPL